MERDTLINADCMSVMATMDAKSVDFTLTDIPYTECNGMKSCGLRTLNVGEKADTLTFDLNSFLDEIYRVTKGTIIVFCGQTQLSLILDYFRAKNKGTTRILVWEKSNPSPMNGEKIYLSACEYAVWFKPRGAGVFNGYCKPNVFKHPIQQPRIHPTEKSHKLLKELIEDNSNPGDIVFDPCSGSGSTLYCAKQLGRGYFGCELHTPFYELSKERLSKCQTPLIGI